MIKNLSIGLAAIILSASAEAGLPAKDLCWQIGENSAGGWRETIKIKAQKALPYKPGIVVQVTGLEHGVRVLDTSLSYFNQLIGSASYIPSGSSQTGLGGVMIALVGTSYGTKDGSADGIPGVWSFNYSLFLSDSVGPVETERLRGTKSFQPTQGASDSETILVDEPVAGISCKAF